MLGFLFMVVALAESAPTSSPIDLSGGSGWVGAGLLGAVLSWLLLKHLPEKDRQIERLITDKDSQITALIKTADDRDDRRRIEDRELRKIERDQCKEDHRMLADHLLANTKETITLAQQTKVVGESMIKLADSWARSNSR